MTPAPFAEFGIRAADVQSLRAHHNPVQAHKRQSFGPDDVAIFLTLNRCEIGRILRQRERRDLDTRITGCFDGAAGLGERPTFKSLIAYGVTEEKPHETIVYNSSAVARFEPVPVRVPGPLCAAVGGCGRLLRNLTHLPGFRYPVFSHLQHLNSRYIRIPPWRKDEPKRSIGICQEEQRQTARP